MLQAAQRQREGNFIAETITRFPCQDLRTLDRLWHTFSHGRFGFAVQSRILIQSGKNNERFADQVGWRVQGKWLWDQELTYTLAAPKGHLPTGFFSGFTGGLKVGLLVLDRCVLQQFTTCRL
jgi:hypothetical protein